MEESYLKRRKKELYFIIPIVIFDIFFFFFAGESGYITMKDTSSYCRADLVEGVMPGYPFFVNMCRVFWGQDYLDAVAAIQGLFAALSTTIFLLFLKKKFSLKYWEGYLLWIAAILPFAIEMPKYVITHVIYTEGITYSLFYLFVICVLNTIWKTCWKWYCMAVFIAFFMGMIRPQLMLLLILTGLLLIYLLLRVRKRKILLSLLAGSAGSCVIIIVGVLGVFNARTFYTEHIEAVFVQRIQSGIDVPAFMEGTEPLDEEEAASIQQNDSLAQVGSAMICRAFYEAEAEDVQYYDDEDMQEIFKRIYAECDKRQILFPYARQGLWMWEDLTQTDIYIVASQEIGGFLDEKDSFMDDGQRQKEITQIKISMALKEIQIHFGRFLYHCIRLMIPGFISCIFFNIESVYLLCHIVVFLLYISAFVMAVYILRSKKADCDAAKFMLASLVSCVVFVGVVNVVFFGMQRYFIYNMGVFYCAYYMVFRVICIELLQKLGWNDKRSGERAL